MDHPLDLHQQRFEALLKASNLGFMMFESIRDAQGSIVDFCWTYVSPAAEKIVGRSHESLVGKFLLQEMPGNREDGLFDIYVQVVETGQVQRREFHYTHEGFNHAFRNQAVKVGDGFAVAFEDITERLGIQSSLKESEERYRVLVTAPNQSVFISSDQQRSSVNSIWTKLTGQTLEASQGDGWLDVIHEQDRERVEKTWRDARETQQEYEFSFRTKAKANKRRYVNIRGVPRFSAQGSLIEWIGIVTDITERKQLEDDNHFVAKVDYILKNSTDPDKLLTDISTEICQHLELPDCYFSDIDEGQGQFNRKAGYSLLKPFVPQIKSLKEYNPLMLSESREKRTLIVTDTSSDERFKDWSEPFKAFVNVPLHRGGKLAGSFTVSSGQAYQWVPKEQQLLETIAGRTWSTLERLRAEKAMQDQSRMMDDQREILALTNVPTLIRRPDSVITSWNKAAEDLYGYSSDEALGRVSHELLQTQFQTSLEEILTRLLEEGYWEEELKHVDKRNNPLVVLSRQALRRDEKGEAQEIIEINFDITGRKQVELEKDRLLGLTQRSEREALALAEIASSFSLTQSLGHNLTVMAERVAITLEALGCAIEIYEENGIDLNLEGYFGYPPGYAQALAALRRSTIETLSQRAIKRQEMIISRDYIASKLGDSRFETIHPMLLEVNWGTAVAVPILNLNFKRKGVVSVYYAPGSDPDITNLLQLSTIVSQMALVVQNAQLFEEAQGKAALEERQKLARDLHDSVSQALYGISLGANSAKMSLSLDTSETKMQEVSRSLDYLIYMADTAMAEMKSLIFELRPESLQSEGLIMALRKHLRALELRYRFNLSLEFSEEPDIALKAKEMLYRITQEAMNNVVKHAKATHVLIRLVVQEDFLSLDISDNGLGFETKQEFPGHLGLQSMRERAEMIGATFSLSSHLNKGTTVSVILSLKQA